MEREKEREWEEPTRRQRRNNQRQEEPGDHSDVSEETTFYVTNLPSQCSVGLLWKEFRNCGRMTDAYLARRRDRAGKFFAFLRFANVMNKEEMVKALRNIQIGGGRVSVNVAKFSKDDKLEGNPIRRRCPIPPQNGGGGENRGVNNYHRTEGSRRDAFAYHDWNQNHESGGTTVCQQPPLHQEDMVVLIPGKSYQAHSSFSKVSLIGTAKDILRLCRLDDFIKTIEEYRIGVQYVTGLKVLLTFISTASAKSFLADMKEVWGEWFSSLVMWEGQKLDFERIAWIKFLGVPISLWDKEVFDLIASKFGRVLHHSSASIRDGSLAMETVGVLTNRGNKIEEKVVVQWRRQTFSVWASEVDELWCPDFVMLNLEKNRFLDLLRNRGNQEHKVSSPGPSRGREIDDESDSEMEEGEIPVNDGNDEVVGNLDDQPVSPTTENPILENETTKEIESRLHGTEDQLHGVCLEKQNALKVVVGPNSQPIATNGEDINASVGPIGFTSRKRARRDIWTEVDLIDLNSPPPRPVNPDHVKSLFVDQSRSLRGDTGKRINRRKKTTSEKN